jgi:NAD(P)-dependent dehydrogenase (short-subunit alcohol dehydrogenase family)
VELSRRGHHVIATARHIEALSDLTTGARLRLDVTDQPSVDAAIAAAGQIDVLVSNAGETLRAPVESVPLHEVERLIQLDTLGATGDPGRASRDALPRLWPDRVRLQRAGTHRAPAAQRLRREQMGAGGDRRTLEIEVGSFGIKVSILQPSGVSSDGAERASVYPQATTPTILCSPS